MKNKAVPRRKKNKLKFATLNVQGINTLGKRQDIETRMEAKKINLVCIQETKINSKLVLVGTVYHHHVEMHNDALIQAHPPTAYQYAISRIGVHELNSTKVQQY